MIINPDEIFVVKIGLISINATIFFTWVVMAVLTLGSIIVTHGITSGPNITRWQSILETVISLLQDQIKQIAGSDPSPFMPFLGTLFVFIFTANIAGVVPLCNSPTASLSTTAALAVSVFFAVSGYGILKRGFLGFVKKYLEYSIIMLPFNIISEVSRIVSLAFRLFGNIMSGSLIGGILLLIVPFFVPVIMHVFALIIGIVQAYIFFTLATIYIASATGVESERQSQGGN